MVRLGIVSDSHGQKRWLEVYAAKCRRECYDCVFHLGDIEEDGRWLEREIGIPIIRVPGNCDPWSKLDREVEASFGGSRILATHGHLYDVKYGLERLSYRAEERGAAIALFGHTHVPCVEWRGRVLMMNPGALADGRCGELRIDNGRMIPALKNLREEF